MNPEPILIAGSSFAAIVLFFGRRATWAAVWAGVLAWKWPEIALVCGGTMLALFLFLEFRKRPFATMPENREPPNDNIIDAEFTIMKPSEEPARWTKSG